MEVKTWDKKCNIAKNYIYMCDVPVYTARVFGCVCFKVLSGRGRGRHTWHLLDAELIAAETFHMGALFWTIVSSMAFDGLCYAECPARP